ncbi:MAG: aldolase [Ramlibacter sp.]
MKEAQARDEICRIGKSLFERGYAHATAGNISMRLDDGFLITPTDACLGFLDAGALSRTDLEGRLLSGLPASKTLAMHRAIYREACRFDAGTRCVIHTHSTHCVAVSLRTGGVELLPPITPYFVMKVGHVPLAAYRRPGAPEAADEVARLVAQFGDNGRPVRAVMLQRLGPNVWHDTPAAAMAVLEELEESAKLFLLSQGSCGVLTEPQIDELRRAFGARW